MNTTLSRRKVLGLTAGSAALAAIGQSNAQAPIIMKLASATVNDVIHHWMKTFKAAVEARAGGRLKVELYPTSQLGAIPRMVEGTALGTIECFVTATGFLTGLDPRFEMFDVPGVLDNTAHAARVFADPEFRSSAFGFGGQRGLESISAFMHSPQNLVTRKPVKTLADLSGQKIRVFSTPIQIESMRKLGAAPVPMPLSEVMPALQNGAIDGFLAASTVFSALKFYDAAKFQTQLPQWPVIILATCNKSWLAKLPTDLREIVLTEARKAEAQANEFGVQDIARAQESWISNGGQILALPPADQASFSQAVRSAVTEVIGKSAAAKAALDAYLPIAQRHKK